MFMGVCKIPFVPEISYPTLVVLVKSAKSPTGIVPKLYYVFMTGAASSEVITLTTVTLCTIHAHESFIFHK